MNRILTIPLALLFSLLLLGCKKNESAQPASNKKLVASMARIIHTIAHDDSLRVSGGVVFSSDSTDTLRLRFFVNLVCNYGRGSSMVAPNSVEAMYWPGVEHSFLGTCRAPISRDGIVDGSLNFFVSSAKTGEFPFCITYKNVESKLRRVYSGAALVYGSGEFILHPKAPVVRIISDAQSPLTMLLTRSGYVYDSGTATIIDSAGAQLTLP
jgi:hypothetical protein